jgi:hypothetical protein
MSNVLIFSSYRELSNAIYEHQQLIIFKTATVIMVHIVYNSLGLLYSMAIQYNEISL